MALVTTTVPIEAPANNGRTAIASAPAPAWTRATGVSSPSGAAAPRVATHAASPSPAVTQPPAATRPAAATEPAAATRSADGLDRGALAGRPERIARAATLAMGVVLVILVVASFVIPRPTGQGDVLGTTGHSSGDTVGEAVASAKAGAPTPPPRVPTAAASALRLTITVDDRLAASAATLRSMNLEKADPVAIATILRTIASDSAWGIDVVGRLGEWPAAAALQGTLREYYTAVAATARDGLSATISSASAYRTAAKRMLAIAGRLVELRTSSVDLAVANGISVPQP